MINFSEKSYPDLFKNPLHCKRSNELVVLVLAFLHFYRFAEKSKSMNTEANVRILHLCIYFLLICDNTKFWECYKSGNKTFAN